MIAEFFQNMRDIASTVVVLREFAEAFKETVSPIIFEFGKAFENMIAPQQPELVTVPVQANTMHR